MKLKIKVVDFQGEKLFRVKKTLFDKVRAEYSFYSGELKVLRGGKVIAKTSGIREIGTHASFMVFEGLAGDWMNCDWKTKAVEWRSIEELFPEYFEVGDEIVIRYRTFGNFVQELKYIFKDRKSFGQIRYIFSNFLIKEDYVELLRYNFIALRSLRGIFEKHGPGSVPLNVIGKDMHEEYWKSLDGVRAMEVLRFREINKRG